MTSINIFSISAIFDVKGWVAIVTGGRTGIGLMAAQTLAANGAKVYITGRRVDVLKSSAEAHGTSAALGNRGGSIVPLAMDVTSKDSLTQAVQQIARDNGYFNVVIKNAGIGSGRVAATARDGAEVYAAAMFKQDIDEWQKVYLVNNIALYFTTSAFVPLLEAAKSCSSSKQPGTVINISFQSGITKWSQNSQYAYNGSANAVNQWVYPIILDAIGWKYCSVYIVILGLYVVIIWSKFPETKGMTIEELSLIFDGERAARMRDARDPGMPKDVENVDVAREQGSS